MANVHPGYMGLVDINGVGQVRFADSSITARQAVDAPDIIMGDYDHDAYNYGKIEVGGSISGPVTETFSSGGAGLWAWATARDSCGLLTEADATVYYYCGDGGSYREFKGMLVNSLGFSCSAGDVAQFTLDLMGKGAEPFQAGDPPTFQDAEKLITWDKVSVTITPGDEDFTVPANIAYSNFDFSLNNNCSPTYALNQANLFPFEIVSGLRTITGSVSAYNTPEANGVDAFDDYVAASIGTIAFNIGGLAITCKARFHRVEPASSVGPILSTIAFTGVGHQSF